MKEKTLKDFFEGYITAYDLADDLSDIKDRKNFDIADYYVRDLKEEYEITSECLIKICDAVLNGTIVPNLLEAIGFCLIASDYFSWDGDTPDGFKVSEITSWWSAPKINYQLNEESVKKFKQFLETGKYDALHGCRVWKGTP
jgi:hypothetical protein